MKSPLKRNKINDIINAPYAELKLVLVPKTTLDVFHKTKSGLSQTLVGAFWNLVPFNPDKFGKVFQILRSNLRNLIREDQKDPVLEKYDSDNVMLMKIYIYYLPT